MHVQPAVVMFYNTVFTGALFSGSGGGGLIFVSARKITRHLNFQGCPAIGETRYRVSWRSHVITRSSITSTTTPNQQAFHVSLTNAPILKSNSPKPPAPRRDTETSSPAINCSIVLLLLLLAVRGHKSPRDKQSANISGPARRWLGAQNFSASPSPYSPCGIPPCPAAYIAWHITLSARARAQLRPSLRSLSRGAIRPRNLDPKSAPERELW